MQTDLAALKTIEAKLKEQASNDGVEIFAVGAVVCNNNKILLLRRVQHDAMGGYYEPPGGGVDAGESLHAAAQRELREEANLHLKSYGPFIGTHDFSSRSGRKIRQFFFAVEVEAGEPKTTPEEHDDFVWAGKDELKSYTLVPAVLSLLQDTWHIFSN
jgi:8-oxo-dGTP diphosphatase